MIAQESTHEIGSGHDTESSRPGRKRPPAHAALKSRRCCAYYGYMSSNPDNPDVTAILHDVSAGKLGAVDRLLPVVYEQLLDLASRYLSRERADHTLQATALVHEAYINLVDQTRVEWQNRAHFLGVAATAMRRLLINHAVRRRTAKRGGDQQRLEWDDALAVYEERAIDLIALDDALKRLAEIDPRQARVVELRFFGGLSNQEIAEVLAVSIRTVEREWRMARAWLKSELRDAESSTDTGSDGPSPTGGAGSTDATSAGDPGSADPSTTAGN